MLDAIMIALRSWRRVEREREREMGVVFFLEMEYLSSKALIFPGICIEIYTRNRWEMGEYLYI